MLQKTTDIYFMRIICETIININSQLSFLLLFAGVMSWTVIYRSKKESPIPVGTLKPLKRG